MVTSPVGSSLANLMESEVKFAKSPLYARKRNIPHIVRGHKEHFGVSNAIFATGDSATSAR